MLIVHIYVYDECVNIKALFNMKVMNIKIYIRLKVIMNFSPAIESMECVNNH